MQHATQQLIHRLLDQVPQAVHDGGIKPEAEKLAQPGMIGSIVHHHSALERWRQRSQLVAHSGRSGIDKAFHAISAEPRVMKQHSDIRVAKNEPCLQRWIIIGDGPMFAEILDVRKWIVQLFWDVEEKCLAFSLL